MPTYVAFLRAINLGARRKFGKDAVAAATRAAGATDVRTYLNTGNVRLDHASTDRVEVEAALESAYLADRGFPVPAMVLTPAELRAVRADLDDVTADHDGRHYVAIGKTDPTPEVQAELAELDGRAGRLLVGGRAVILLVGPDQAPGRLGTAVERVWGPTTVRTAAVVRTLTTNWCSDEPAGGA